MQAAEGKGPKQTKSPYALGKFITIYGNGDNVYNTVTSIGSGNVITGTAETVTASSVVNSGSVAWPAVASGTTWNGGTVGSAVPGLNLNVNGNGVTDVSFVCAPEPLLTLADMETLYVDFWLTTGFSGTCFLQLQGSNDRFYQNTNYNSAAWITLVTGTVTSSSGNQTFTINNTATTAENPKLAYRITASGGTGIINWAIPGMYVDYYAMGIGSNSIDTNGNIGQMSIQNVRILSIVSGTVVSGQQPVSVTNGTTPYSNINTNHTFLGN
jgi:hypothetical protein